MPAKTPSMILSECLQDRNLTLNTSELLSNIDSTGKKTFEAWVTENLGTDTLLTKEELILYNSLQKSGEAQVLKYSQDLNHVRAFDDEETQNAIDQLRSSTATIDKQSAVLKIQQDALSLLVATNLRQQHLRSAANTSQQKIWTGARDKVNASVEELANYLLDYVNGSESQYTATDTSLMHQSADILRSDDKILSSLQKLSGVLNQGSSSENDASEHIRQLCASFIKYTVESVRIRLDRVYIESLDGSQVDKNDTSRLNGTEIIELQTELDSLYSEIIPVAQMSVEERYLHCALQAIATQGNEGLERSRRIVAYISGCITFLINRLEDFSAQAEEYQGHIAALNASMQFLNSEIDPINSISPEKPEELRSPLQRKLPKSMSTIQSRIVTHRRSSSSSFDEVITPEQQILRFLGILAPEQLNQECASDMNLQGTLTDRMEKLKAHEQNLQRSSESAIGEHLQDAFATLQLLRDSMLSETKAHQVQLVDDEVQGAITDLEQELVDLLNGVQSASLEKLGERNLKQDALIERWAR